MKEIDFMMQDETGMNEEDNWAAKEFRGANIGDKRLVQRLITVTKQFISNPSAQIPESAGSAGTAKATYRLFDNDKITQDKIFNPHYEQTKKRLNGKHIILAIQDTTELNYTSHSSVDTLGPLGKESNRGFMLHPTLAVGPGGVPLGLIDFNIWTRSAKHMRNDNKNRPIEEKESSKWINSYRQTAKLAECATDAHFVNICDREGDIYYLFNEAKKIKTNNAGPDLLVRAAQDRKLQHSQKRLWSYMEEQDVAGKVKIKVAKRDKQPKRKAGLSIRYAKVCIKAPVQNKDKGTDSSIILWAVYANEEHPPNAVSPISWMLLTTIEINNLEEALEKIKWYTQRWLIELFFKILKSGCKVEAHQLKTVSRLKNCIVLDAIIAWRVMFLTYLGRQLPDLPASVLFEEYEWKSLYSYINKTAEVPAKEPTVGTVVAMLSKLGGFLGRKSDGYPGMMSVWKGLSALYYISTTWKIFNS